MGGMDGLALVREIHTTRPDTQVVLMTAFGGIDTAVEAIKAGAYHFVAKPVKLPEVGALVRKALTERDLRRENRDLRQAVEARYSFGQLLGKSAVMQRLFVLLERLAATSSTVLIQGESGTGKELVARALHYHSPRRRHPFVPVNCAALPEGLLESELFGHTKGAFTGAQIARRGLFLEASRGTMFLDEMGEMPLAMQAKLLRVLEQRQLRPVGSDREVDVDVRVLVATNQDLARAVQQGHVPRGPLLSAPRHACPDTAAARSTGRISPCWPRRFYSVIPPPTRCSHDASPVRRCTLWSSMIGQGMCASCPMSSNRR